ncbi:hypothetical protein ACN27E_10480 [Mycobacterium sp. WMMD1722]|uniref:hypothetical protein n=1 Tax=Mycobacterium sp. WMMD1722 TaxID=3404117 RepID=UPI003BF5AFFA
MVEEVQQPWWATDPNLAEILKRSREEFEAELEARAPRSQPEDAAERDVPDPVLNDIWSGTSKRELAAARDDLASILGVSRQTLHRRFAKGRA